MNAVTPVTRMRKVMVATPCMDGKLEARYVHSLTQSIRLCTRHGIDLREIVMAYDAILPNLRNALIRIGLEYDFDDLIFIDADQDWEPGWIVKLLSHPVDCVGGTYRKKQDAERYEVNCQAGAPALDPVTGLLKVAGLGCGFLRLSRRALQALWDSAEPYRCRSEPPTRWIFDIRPHDGELVGEDIGLARKLAALGIPTYLDPSMTCGHTGAKRFAGDFAKWLEAETVRRTAGASQVPA